MFCKSNKWHAATDILQTECRQWDLKERERERQKGVYTKRKLEYWDRDINKIRRENIILSDISNSQADPVKRIGQVYQPITINVILENVLLWS